MIVVIECIEMNLSGEKVNNHKRHFQSTRNIVVHRNVIKSTLISVKNEVLRNFNRYNTRNTRYRFGRVVHFDQNNPLRGGTYI